MFKKEPQTNFNLLEKQVEPLFKATLSGGLGNILAAILVYLVLEDTVNQTFVFQVCVMIIAVSVFRIITSRIYLLNRKNNLYTFLHSHVFLTFIIGSLWGYIAYIQMYTNDDVLRNLIFLINFGLIAASIATLSTWMMAYMLPQSLAILYVFSTLQSGQNIFMMAAYLTFILSMVITSMRFSRNHQTQIQLIFNNKQLIGDLSNEIEIRENVQLELEQKKTDLEKNKSELEDKVKGRTKELKDSNLHLESVIAKKKEAEKIYNIWHTMMSLPDYQTKTC